VPFVDSPEFVFYSVESYTSDACMMNPTSVCHYIVPYVLIYTKAVKSLYEKLN